MSKGIVHDSRFAQLANNAASGAAGSDLIFTEVDTGGAVNGTLILVANVAAASDAMRNLEIWTSSASDFATSGTALAAVSSDGTAKVLIASDNSYMFAEGAEAASISDLTVSSNGVSSITEDGMYIITLPNVSRYINVQYDSSGAGSEFSAVFVGHNLAEARWKGKKTAY